MGCNDRQHRDVVWIDLFGSHTCAQHWLVADLFGQRPLPCKGADSLSEQRSTQEVRNHSLRNP